MTKRAAIIGAGPAGLMAAETISAAGVAVTVYDRMPSVGRKLLMAGRGGLNLTHSEPLPAFLGRYGQAAETLGAYIDAFPPDALTTWANGLGQETFTGSSGRVFPKSLKASPLLRAWLARLQAQGVEVRTRHEWLGWSGDGLRFATPQGEVTVQADAVVLALGGASWPRLGSTGDWAGVLAAQGVEVAPFAPANCGFTLAWSDIFRERFAGQPLKNVAIRFQGQTARGDAMVSRYGLEGGPIYALSAALRDALGRGEPATVYVDLRRDLSGAQLAARLAPAHGGQSLATWLKKALKLSPLEINILREGHGVRLPTAPEALAAAIKSVPLTLTGMAAMDRAISTAGGVTFGAVDGDLMLTARPGTFVAGEMLDWEAPTGGYLLQAVFATGKAAGDAAVAWMGRS